MSGLIEAIAVVNLAEQSLTAHERKKFYERDPWSGVDQIFVKLLDATDINEVRYHVKGIDSRFNRLDYQEIKCISEADLRKLMEDFEV